jgi:nucleoside-diphosphate-sugar epimerase
LARVLIVGCGCRGRALAASIAADGHAVRGTTRDEASLPTIRETGAEAVAADPDRLATLLPALTGVSVICWLMGSASSPALHGPRLQSLLEQIVDTPVRGVVYEAAGSAPNTCLEQGAAIVRAAGET